MNETPLQWRSDGSQRYVVRAATWPGEAAPIFDSPQAAIDRVDVRTGRRSTCKTLTRFDPVGHEAVNQRVRDTRRQRLLSRLPESLNDLFVLTGLQ